MIDPDTGEVVPPDLSGLEEALAALTRGEALGVLTEAALLAREEEQGA